MRTVQPCCHACGRALPKPKPTAIPHREMTDAELFAAYRKISPREDLAFLLRTSLSVELRAHLESIAHPTRPILKSAVELWRIERATADRWEPWSFESEELAQSA